METAPFFMVGITRPAGEAEKKLLCIDGFFALMVVPGRGRAHLELVINS